MHLSPINAPITHPWKTTHPRPHTHSLLPIITDSPLTLTRILWPWRGSMTQVRGLSRSSELSRMLPSEMVLLAHGWPRKVRCSYPTRALQSPFTHILLTLFLLHTQTATLPHAVMPPRTSTLQGGRCDPRGRHGCPSGRRGFQGRTTRRARGRGGGKRVERGVWSAGLCCMFVLQVCVAGVSSKLACATAVCSFSAPMRAKHIHEAIGEVCRYVGLFALCC